MMIGGIEQLISERMDANRNNPEALMQSYSQNQQLIDLLALQKLKSEKEAAARQTQLQMQQQPQTIAQQREAELLAMTRDEVARNAGGAYQQEEQERQKAMQQVANSGIASVAKGMPAMAQGGIVSFKEGGEVAEKRRQIEDALQQGATISDLEKIFRNDPEAMTIIQEIAPAAEPADISYGAEFDEDGGDSIFSRAGKFAGTLSEYTPLAMYKKLWDAAGEYGPNVEEALAAFSAGVSGETPPRIPGMFERRPQQAPSAPEDVLEEVVPQGERIETPPPPPPPQAAPTAGPTTAAAPVDTLGSALEESLISGLGIDVDAEGIERRDATEKYLNVKEMQDIMRPYLEKMRAMERSPQEQARERLIASLTNMAGRSTPGMTFAAGARGGINALARQRAEGRQSLQDQLDLEKGIGQLGLGAREKALAAEEAARAEAGQNIRQSQSSGASVMNTGAQLDANEAQRYMADAQKAIANDAKLMNLFASVGVNIMEGSEMIAEVLQNDENYPSLIRRIAAEKNKEKRSELEAAAENLRMRLIKPISDQLESFKSMQQRIGTQLGMPELTTGGAGQPATATEGFGKVNVRGG